MPDRPLPYDDDALKALKPQAKRLLRKRLRGLRRSLPEEARAARSAEITARVAAMPEWEAARTVALYASMSDELDTQGLIDRALAAGKRVVLPVTEDRGPLDFRLGWEGGRPLPREYSAFGVEEPTAACPLVPYEELDFVLVPALAVDLRGYRLGYGAGHYDQTLPLCTRAVSVVAVFDFQLVGEVPDELHDVAARWVITDRRTVDVLDSKTEVQ